MLRARPRQLRLGRLMGADGAAARFAGAERAQALRGQIPVLQKAQRDGRNVG